MKKINLLLIGYPELKNYFSKDFNIIIPDLKKKYFISDICKKHKIDVIFQVENLSKREIIIDINEQHCLKIFWAIDIHLNFYWQKYYFENFDIILTTQKNFLNRYNGKIFWLPWGIHDEFICKEFIPFKRRKFDISFVGLIDRNRVKRKQIIDLISSHFNIFLAGTNLEKRLPLSDMLDIYKNSKIVINESILRDVNFRYFEVTSQGALLYSEKINNGEDELFEDKKEVLYYSQLNIITRLKYYLKNQEKLEKIAYNGWLKTKKYHKLSDRVKEVEKIILKNLNNSSKKTKSIDYPLIFTYLRGIGEPEYKKIFFENCKDETLKVLFSKCFDEDFFNKISNKYETDPLIKLNKISFNLESIVKFLNKNFNKLPDYYTGYLNLICKNKIFLSIYEVIDSYFEKFPDKAIKHKSLNYIGGKILFKNENYQGAIRHFLNLIREFPEKILYRKYLATCYFKIFNLELFKREVLKIYLLDKKFEDFKKFKINSQIKKEILFEIMNEINNKKLIRDIIFNLSDFYESNT